MGDGELMDEEIDGMKTERTREVEVDQRPDGWQPEKTGWKLETEWKFGGGLGSAVDTNGWWWWWPDKLIQDKLLLSLNLCQRHIVGLKNIFFILIWWLK